MFRHQKRIRNVINTHSTTLIPLFDSAHWFLVEVNTDTRTFTFYNSYGKHGQRKWSPTLKAWLTHHMHGPWTAAQGIAIQQPGTTECGTHTLLNIMKHIPGAPSPDTSTIHWSHHMRTHIINTITASGYTTDITDTNEDSPDVVHVQPRKKQQCTGHAQPTTRTHPQMALTTHRRRKPNREGQVPPPPPSPLTHNTANTTLQDTTSGRTNQRRQGKRKVSAMALTPTGHIIARDCLLHAPTLHWEGDRNDQCETCDEGGTLTECTRCNLVWHASCLHPTPIFPLRRQDAIVCGEQCWTELTTAALNAGSQAPTRDTNTTPQPQNARIPTGAANTGAPQGCNGQQHIISH